MEPAQSLISRLMTPTSIISLLLAIFLVRILIRTFVKPNVFSTMKHMQTPPVRNRFLGLLPELLRSDPGECQSRWVTNHGPFLRLLGPLGSERLLIVKPDLLHQLLVTDWLDNPRPGFLRHILGIVAGYGLLTVTGDVHKQMRKTMNPAFSIQALSQQTDVYYDTIDTLTSLLKSEILANEDGPGQGKVMTMYEWMSKTTLDIICLTAFGYKTDSLRDPHNELAEAYENVIELQSVINMFKLVLLLHVPGVPKLLNSKWAYEHSHLLAKINFFRPIAIMIQSMYRIRGISKQILREKVVEAAAPGETPKKDIMSLLVKAQSTEQGEKMSEQAMVDQVLTFLGAGHETTASGLAWTLWLLAANPETQKKLRDEVKPKLAENPRPDYRTLKEMQYLDCVVMESLRLMPPVPQTVRVSTKDQIFDGVVIPRGTAVSLPIYSINRWKEMWGDDADQFRPERWLELPKNYSPQYSVLTFLAGPHACIGKTMAIIEEKAVIATLVSQFEFEKSSPTQVAKPTAAITMKPGDNMPLRVKILKS